MIDARNVYRKVTRKIYDFSPEQLQNLASIVWLYRGERDRFLELVQSYLHRTPEEAAAVAPKLAAFGDAEAAVTKAVDRFVRTLPADSAVRQLAAERDEASRTVASNGVTRSLPRVGKSRLSLSAQKKLLERLAELAVACRGLVKDVDLVCKLSARVVDGAERDAGARDSDVWDSRAIGRLIKELDARRRDAVDQLKLTAYVERQADWLLSRFPDAEFTAVPGLCRAVAKDEIEAADWSLTAGRYVGVAPAEVDEDFDFEQTMREIHSELADLNAEAAALAARIQENIKGLGL